MSKSKGKDKKNDHYIQQLEKQFQNQKREHIDATFTLKKLQERYNFLIQENHRLVDERQNQFIVLNENIEELSIKNETNEKRLITMRNDLTNSEVENKKLINAMSLLDKNMSDERSEKTKQFQEMRKNCNFELTKYENMLTDYKLYMGERDSRQKEINQLFEAKEIEVANRIRDVADKERQKVQATDKIRDEMGNKIRDMRQNLLSLKKEELETTTRLTMLQNHQLTNELEYQSKQTERIVFKNEEMEGTITKLKQQLDIHKQIEDELAKRAHFSKGIIKKLHAKVEQLEEEAEKTKKIDLSNHTQSDEGSAEIQKERGEKEERLMTQAMEKELERSEKKHAELHSRHELLRRERDEMALKWESSQRIKNELFNALLRSYTLMVGRGEKGSEIKQNIAISLNLTTIKQKHPQEWSEEELKGVLQILLLTCQSYLTNANLNIASLRTIVAFGGEKEKDFRTQLPKLSTDRGQKRMGQASSEKRLQINDDVCTLARNELCKQKYSINITTKLVSSKLRDWGRQVPCRKKSAICKKYQLSSSYRM